MLRQFATIFSSDYNANFVRHGHYCELHVLARSLRDGQPSGAFLACPDAPAHMSRERKIVSAEILGARRTERISLSALSDFSLGKTRPGAVEGTLLPYCLDLLRRRAIYVGGVSAREAQAAPFYYLYLRRAARTSVLVPWESTPLSRDEVRAPILLFSPGRCGSTLVSRILYEAGVANVSEADFYTQATSRFSSSPLNPFRRGMRRAVLGMGRDLCASLSAAGPVVVKLRAESCRAPRLVIDPNERRALFVTRNFESWARSTVQTFRNGPRKTVQKYLTALACRDVLQRNCECLVLHYEDLTADPDAARRALEQFLLVKIAPSALERAMNKDSQEGTPLARGARGDTPATDERLENALALWNSDKVKRIRGRFVADGK